jgi:hypothetical protein
MSREIKGALIRVPTMTAEREHHRISARGLRNRFIERGFYRLAGGLLIGEGTHLRTAVHAALLIKHLRQRIRVRIRKMQVELWVSVAAHTWRCYSTGSGTRPMALAQTFRAF